MDNLIYTCQSNSNKLTKVTDTANNIYGFKDGANLTTEYLYDANGNMKTDANKNITAIQYNYLNLPTQVTINGQNILYVYDATGVKLRKTVNTTTTDYANGFIYENNVLQFFNQPEGYVEISSPPSGELEGAYVYQYKDHLGNIRLSYSDANHDGSITASTEIKEENNYYPFGLKHKGYNSNINGTHHKYMFSGKEFDESFQTLNTYDFGARNYDPALGRWMNVDPLAEQMRRHSPYNYAFDNPIRYTDPDGRSPWDVIITGEKSKEAFKQLNASTNLRLKMDESGKVTAKGNAKTDTDKVLLEAINSKTVEVNINATSSNFTDEGNWFVGGAFGGSEVNGDGKVITSQTVNSEMTGKIDEFYGAQNGVSVLHEVIESYIGGKESPGIGSPTFDDVQNKTPAGVGYLNAHNKTEALDQRHVAPNIIDDPKGIFISKFPYDPNIPKALNPEILINDLKK